MLNSHAALSQTKTCSKPKIRKRKPRWMYRTLNSTSAYSAGIQRILVTLIEIRAPVSGTIVEQNISGFEGIKSLDNSPSLFTIADLSQVWVLCDVYENDLGAVHLGDHADLRLNAYAENAYHGTVTDISRVLDPTTRSAKVRIVLPNRDGSLRPGMFAVATFRSRTSRRALLSPPLRLCGFRTRIGCFARNPPAGFGAWRYTHEEQSLTECSRSRSGCKPAMNWSPTPWSSRPSRRGAGQVISYVIDFALRNRILVLSVAPCAFHLGRRFIPQSAHRGISRMSRTPTPKSSPSGRDTRPRKWNNRSQSRSKFS